MQSLLVVPDIWAEAHSYRFEKRNLRRNRRKKVTERFHFQLRVLPVHRLGDPVQEKKELRGTERFMFCCQNTPVRQRERFFAG